jgi:hypothetical protein
MNRSATSVISPNSSAGTRKRRSGRSSTTMPSANATGLVVIVRIIEPRKSSRNMAPSEMTNQMPS